VDGRGFILVDDQLRSVSHPEVLAAGDCATLRDAPHPKSGVYAVRHAPVLAANLRGAGRRYRPQRRALMLLSCGARYAIADWGGLSWEGAWVWRWKDRIDRRWVEGFRT
jgi:selenide,water dikinase